MKNYLSSRSVRTSIVGALLALSTLATPVMAHEYRVGDIEVVHPFAPPTPPGVAMAAGYLEIINHGEQDERLVGGAVDFAEELQIHETTVEGDVSRMRQLTEGLVIPAGATVKFQPMGKHLMFTQLAEPLVEGERMSATLSFETAGDLQVEFAIEHPDSDAMKMDHGDMDHGDMNMDSMKKDAAHKHQ